MARRAEQAESAAPRAAPQERSALLGARIGFAVTLAALGLLGLVHGDVPQTWGGVGKSASGFDILRYLWATVALGCGLGLLWRRAAAVASLALLAGFLLWLVFVRLPHVFAAPASLGPWWDAADTAVMAAAAWILHATLAARAGATVLPTGPRGARFAQALYGLALLPFGIAHFAYFRETASQVPAWLPWHEAWVATTGVAFIAAGLAIVAGFGARLAAALSALQVAAFTVLVWIPIAMAGPNAYQWSEFLDSWALTAGACVVAASYGSASAKVPAAL